ncbi:type II secretion system F family protein [Cellulomonas composti]|uniref:Pilus assembly protein TadB n=1 Tax=Cellulomonas composti TaxID=266130 RepID=A0A511JBU0_9CELL|nr:type II secretion system F family protein [Cellulomonas composti]GEL95457.1 pilus assembly protein TadB [Cellulomonas composti]
MSAAPNPVVLGACAGLLVGLGVWLVVARLRGRRTTLDQRLAPYLRPRRTSSTLLHVADVRGPLAVLERVLAPLMNDGMALAARVGSPTVELRRRLSRAGSARTVEQFRAGQVVTASLATAGGLALALVLATTRGTRLPALVVLVLVGGFLGLVGPDWLLSRRVRERETRIAAELPTLAELLALAVGAGEGVVGALERVVRTTHGELSGELARTLSEARAGAPLTTALDHLADRTGVPALARFAEGVAVAMERGSPLADVLRAQAQDVRDEGRRELMETGGRKEVLMMVPVVFLILPVTVVFAVFPSSVVLQVGL